MTGLNEWAAVFVAFVGVITSSITAIIAYRLTWQSQKAEMQREIGHLYDRLMDFRALHPEVLELSRRWTEACFTSIYTQRSEKDKKWALYYTYAELCTAFVNTVLFARTARLISTSSYKHQYQKLLKLLLTGHYPYLTTILHGKYLSSYIIEFMKEMGDGGWNWAEMHKVMQLSSLSRPGRKVRS